MSPTRRELYYCIIAKHSCHNLKQKLTTKKSPIFSNFLVNRPKTLFKKEPHRSLFYRKCCNILQMNYPMEHIWTAAFVLFVLKRMKNDICESLGSFCLHINSQGRLLCSILLFLQQTYKSETVIHQIKKAVTDCLGSYCSCVPMAPNCRSMSSRTLLSYQPFLI